MNRGGMEIPEAYTLPDQLQIPYVIQYLRWDKMVANDILVTLDNIQLNAGFVTPIMEDRRLGINYVDQGLLVSPRGRMEK